jgi:hypothetical protein
MSEQPSNPLISYCLSHDFFCLSYLGHMGPSGINQGHLAESQSF